MEIIIQAILILVVAVGPLVAAVLMVQAPVRGQEKPKSQRPKISRLINKWKNKKLKLKKNLQTQLQKVHQKLKLKLLNRLF